MLDMHHYYDIFLKDACYRRTCTWDASAFPGTAHVNQLCFSTDIQEQNTLRDHLQVHFMMQLFPWGCFFSSLSSPVFRIKHISNLPVAQEWYTGYTFCVQWCGHEHLLPTFIYIVSTLITTIVVAAPSISCPRKNNSNWKYLFQNHF